MSLKHVIGYVRVSTAEQAREGASLDVQERIIREHAARNGWMLDRVFVEKGESAKTTDRTELQAMLRYCKENAKKVDAVLVYKIDRLTRKNEDYYSLRGFFTALGIEFVSVSEPVQDDAVGRFVAGMFANVAQLDNDMRSERCRNGMKEAIRNGRYVWKAPLGYQNTIVNGKKNIAPEEPQARFIRRGFDLIDNGYTPTEALRVLEKDGFRQRNGNRVSFTHWSKLLRHTLYAGKITAFGEVTKGSFAPIVDAAVFERVQVVLRGNSAKLPVYRKCRDDFSLRGLLVCTRCEKRLTGSWSRGRHGKKYPFYHCTRCKGVRQRRDDVEVEFLKLLATKNMDENLAEMLRIAIAENLKTMMEGNEKRRHDIRRRITELESEQAHIVKKNIAGTYNDDMAKRLTEKAETEIHILQQELAAIPTMTERVDHIVEYGLRIMCDVRTAWNAFELAPKQRFQSFLFPEGVPFDHGKFGTPKTALILEIKTTFRDGKLLLVAPRGIEPLLTA